MLTKKEKDQILNEKVEYIRKLVNIFTVSLGKNQVNYDVDDMVQISIIAVYNALDGYDVNKGAALDTYISNVIKNAVTDCKRKYISYSSHTVPLSGYDDNELKTDGMAFKNNDSRLAAEQLSAVESKTDFITLLEKLRNLQDSKKNFERYGSIALLNNVSGITLKETAESLGIQINCLRSYVSQLRKKLLEDPDVIDLIKNCA